MTLKQSNVLKVYDMNKKISAINYDQLQSYLIWYNKL